MMMKRSIRTIDFNEFLHSNLLLVATVRATDVRLVVLLALLLLLTIIQAATEHYNNKLYII